MIQEHTLRTVLWYSTGIGDKNQLGYHFLINIIGSILGIRSYQSDSKRPSTCYRCRRDRYHRSCLRCPYYSRRNWLESLELGIGASIAGLLVMIVVFYGMGIK